MRFYLGMLVLLAPWLLLFYGGARRSIRRNTRVRRFQMEGAALLVLDVLGKWAVYDPHFGLLHRYPGGNWPYWFSRGDAGFFWVGLLLFCLGYFLERRPGPHLQPWPPNGKRAAWMGILCGAWLGLIVLYFKGVPWGEAPWSAARIWFTLGWLPFAAGYVFWLPDSVFAPDEE